MSPRLAPAALVLLLAAPGCTGAKGADTGGPDLPPCDSVESTVASTATVDTSAAVASLDGFAIPFASVPDTNGDGYDELFTAYDVPKNGSMPQLALYYGPITGVLSTVSSERVAVATGEDGADQVGDDLWSNLPLGPDNSPWIASLGSRAPFESHTQRRQVLFLFDPSTAAPGGAMTPAAIIDPTPVDEDPYAVGVGGLAAVTDLVGDGVPGVLLASTASPGGSRLDFIQGPMDSQSTVSDSTTRVDTPDRPLTLSFSERGAGDFNGDGYTDVAAIGSGGIEIFAGSGSASGSFAAPFATFEGNEGCRVGDSHQDLTNDGLPDLLLGCPYETRYSDPDDITGTGALYVFANPGPGTHALSEAAYAFTGSADTNAFGWDWRIDDLDEDGQMDLLVSAPGRPEADRDPFHQVVDALVTTFLDPSAPACGTLSLDDATGGVHRPDTLGATWGSPLDTMDNDGDGVRDILISGDEGLALYSGAAVLGR